MKPLTVEAALDEAFAPLRTRTANIGPTRVRAAVRWAPPEQRRLRGLALLSRITELSLAAVISAFVFAGSVASLGTPVIDVPDVTRDATLPATRVPNGRFAFQRPIDSRLSGHQTIGAEMIANAAIARREAARSDQAPEQTASNR